MSSLATFKSIYRTNIFIESQYANRLKSHPTSTKTCSNPPLKIGDVVYLRSDGNKHQGRPRYIVVSIDDQHCQIRKFGKDQFRKHLYKVRLSDCFSVSEDSNLSIDVATRRRLQDYDESDSEEEVAPSSRAETSVPFSPPPIPMEISSKPDEYEATFPSVESQLPLSNNNSSSYPSDNPCRKSSRRRREPAWLKNYVK